MFWNSSFLIFINRWNIQYICFDKNKYFCVSIIISNFSALRKDGRAGPLVAAKRGPQFTGGQDRQGGQSRRGQRDFGQDDSIGGEDGTAEYNFAYEVNSDEGAQFSQQEEASGGVITGEYRVNLPDGRVQIVR